MIKFKVKLVALAASVLAGSVFANGEVVDVVDVETTVGTQQSAVFAESTVQAPDSGNKLEKVLTPSLLELGEKKVLLENKTLDLSLKKADIELLKVKEEAGQIERKIRDGENGQQDFNNLSNAPNGGMATPSGNPQMNGFDIAGQLGNAISSRLMVGDNLIAEEAPRINMDGTAADNSDSRIRVLMISGDSKNLSAKIMSGGQGGYVVEKGDTLPNGKLVVAVTSEYIVVKPKDKKGNKFNTKIYVTGYPDTSEQSYQAAPAPMPQADSAQIFNPISGGGNMNIPFGIPSGKLPLTR